MHSIKRVMAVYLAAWFAFAAAPGGAPAQEQKPPPAAGGEELVAIMDLGMLDGTKAQQAALTNQLRAEVVKTGRVTLVDRSQLNAVLEEQALQQTGCTDQECAVDVGKILGIRKIVTGSITRIDEKLWQISVQLTDVETAAALRVETFNHEGTFQDLLFNGMAKVAKTLFPSSPQQLVEQTRPAPAPQAVAAPPPPAPEDEGGSSWWVWAVIGLGVVGAAVALGGGGGGGGGGDTASECPSASGCGTVGATW